jgi:hypothetical protein
LVFFSSPIVHFSEAKPPFVICVADRSEGELEKNIESLNLKEGKDYWHFN